MKTERVEQHLYAHSHLENGVYKVDRIECLLCNETIMDASGFGEGKDIKNVFSLHFELNHGIIADLSYQEPNWEPPKQ